MASVRDTIKGALKRQKINVAKASLVAGVPRLFLQRLVKGDRPPPRTKVGRVRADERYARLARALGLNEKEFLDQVRKEQGPPSSRSAAIQEALAQQGEGDEGSSEREAIFQDLLAKRLKLQSLEARLVEMQSTVLSGIRAVQKEVREVNAQVERILREFAKANWKGE